MTKIVHIIIVLGLTFACARVDHQELQGDFPGANARASLAVSFVVRGQDLVGQGSAWGSDIGAKSLGASVLSSDQSALAPYSGEQTGALALDVDQGTDPDYRPVDVWVIQYGGVADDAPLVGLPRYTEISGMTNIQAVASATPNTLIFVANTHDANLEFGDISTLGKMKLSSLSIARPEDCYGNNCYTKKDLMFSGQYQGPVNTSAISVGLSRNVARLDLKIINGAASGLTLQDVQLCNVPGEIYLSSALVPTDALFPLRLNYIDYPAEPLAGAANPGTEQSLTFFMPVNQRGVASLSTSSKLKSTYAPGQSTYFRIQALDAQGAGHVYKIYPGANMVNDYNLSANKAYRFELSINSPGDASTDGRVQDYGLTNLASSNSFILNPAPSGAADRVFTIAIDRVNLFWAGVDPSLTIGEQDEWTVEVIWQDVPTAGMIRFFDLATSQPMTSATFTGRGPDQRLALITRRGDFGNALIGIKKTGQTTSGYLWSWHLWVSDYNPDYHAPPVLGQYIYRVDGGAVHRYDGPDWNPLTGKYKDKYMMDRNLGARSSSRSVDGSLYYEFGRKDPFPCIHPTCKLYDINGTLLANDDPRNAIKIYHNSGYGVTMATSVLNPVAYLYRDPAFGTGDWCSEGKAGQHPWNDPAPGLDRKSFFDPCPAGWKLPEHGVWSDFVYQANDPSLSTTLNTSRDNRLGWQHKGEPGVYYWPRGQEVMGTICFQALGHRHAYTGVMSSIDTGVYYLTSTPASEDYGFFMYSNGATVIPGNTMVRTNGISVRCVQQ